MNEVAVALEIRLLGQADVIAAGRSIKFAKRATTLALIAFLALRPDQSIARDFLAYTLFPDQDDESALADLRRCLYLTTKALPAPIAGPWLIIDNETVRWNSASGATVDALHFDRLARDPSRNAEAIEIYRGDLLEDLYDDWIVVERERLRTRYLQILSGLIERHRDAREYGLALGYAHRLLASEIWREDVARQAMAIRYAWGDTPGALAEYDRFVKRLRDDMNIGPMPETVALRQAILRNEPLAGGERAPAMARGTARATPARVLPFTGRGEQRDRLQQHWDRAARGYGNVAVVSGEAGIGKTRLVGELVQIVEREGGRAFCGGTAFPESPPYQCLVETLRSAQPVFNAHPMPPLIGAILARIVPELANEAHPMPAIAALAPEREAARLFDAFARAFVHIAASRPALFVFEDLHWAAGTTIDAIAAVARRIAKTRALIVCTYRDEETPMSHPLRRLVDALGSEQRFTQLHLKRLERDDVERMLARLGSPAATDPRFTDRFYAFSEGNPLFLNEALADASEVDSVAVPAITSSIREVIGARVDRLSENARTIAQIASICGHGCSVDIVRDIAGFDLADTLAGFNELLDRRLVREAGARDRADYVFTHHLIGTSIYDGIPPALRVRRHARAAHVIEALPAGAGTARELARHYDLAGLAAQAERWCVRAATEAAAVYATDDTIRFATTALRHVPGSIEALLLREEANARLGNRDEQRADLDRLHRLPLDLELRCRVARRRVLLARALGERDVEREAIGALKAAAAAASSAHWAGTANCAQARFHLAAAAYAEAGVAARAALECFAASGSAADRIEAFSVLIEAGAAIGDIAGANGLLGEAQAIAHDAAAAVEIHMQAASLLMPQQRFAEVLVHASGAVAGYRALGDRVGEARALVNVATSAVRLSHWEQAREANRNAAEVFETIGDRAGLARVLMNLSMLHARCGDLGHARQLVRAARELHVGLGDERARTASLLNESFLALWQAEPQAAKTLAQEALIRAEGINHAAYRAQALGNLGAAERDLGQLDAAIAHMGEGLELQLELGRLPDAVSDLADLALTHARHGDLAAALRAAERILTIDSPWIDCAVFPPYPPWIVACVLHWSGDDRAADLLKTAAGILQAFAASIDDPELRAHFMTLPFVAQVDAALTRDAWPAQPSTDL